MSIKSDAYSLCKTAWKSPLRDRIRTLIATLNQGQIGYLGRHQYVQALGYLMADKKRAELEKTGSLRIEPMGSNEVVLLSSLHKQLVLLNEKCVGAISPKIQQCIKAIDPYNRFNFQMPSDISGQDILDKDAVAVIAGSFSKHPAMDIAATSMSAATQHMTEDQYIQAVLNFDMNLMKAGVFKVPEDLAAVIYSQSKDSPSRMLVRQIAALTCIRASLSTLDQLVYQAVLNDKLPLLGDNNIIEIGNLSNNLVGRGLSVIYQPGQEAQFVSVWDLALVRVPSLHMASAQLWRVEAVHLEYSQDFGTSSEVKLREIDDNLNPYRALLQHM